ncbi:TRAP transporter small permease [Pseudalkalibacillus salsuginis]|uniref:TRAP transporter small permease n=1 Tax=Pseudalkalibacillus salsuginis TaxID=2910972 RepID=UPI001F48B552|nr:TRAP transporter small permease [Pseudalkalibacillus salsuginis]MCF6408583.1 TRAP transporter small permease [Pseudalkalibacillus salsuginis]
MVIKIKLILDRFILFITGFFSLVLFLGAIWQVASRYLLNTPSTFTEELLRFLLIWTSILGASYAFGSNQHLAITFLKDKLKGKNKLAIRIINDLVIFVFAYLIMIRGGMELVGTTMLQKTPILSIPMGIVYSILPISGVIIIIYKLLLLSEYRGKMPFREEN